MNDISARFPRAVKTNLFRGIFAAVALLASAMLPAYSADYYVATNGVDTAAGTSDAPFATIGAAITAANTAIDGGEDSATVHVADGTYTHSAVCILSKPIIIVGNTANPTNVVLNNAASSHQAFRLTNASAAVKGVTITGSGKSDNTGGGHIYMTAGLLEDCVVMNGGGNSAYTYGGNVYMTGGRLRRCKILSGKATYNTWTGHGGNIYATAGIVENCLVAGGNAGFGSGIYANGAVKVVNCTFVKNPSGGAVYVNNPNAKIVNCAIYGNGGTAATEWSDKNAACFINCAFSAEAAYSGTASTIKTLTASDFVDYDGGDYRPAESLNLLECGLEPSDYISDFSATDLGGLARVSPDGGTIDLGCYEYQLSGPILTGAISPVAHYHGDPVVCSASVIGDIGEMVYKWDLDDGDPVITTEPYFNYTYARTGIHTNTLYLSTDGGATWSVTNKLEGYVTTVVPTDIYVVQSNESPVFPYDTAASATTNLNVACTLANLAFDQGLGTICTVHVADGTYTHSAVCTLSKPIIIVGNTANPTNVVLNNAASSHQAFRLINASAAVKGVTITGSGKSDITGGGHIYMTAGLLEDCVVMNGGGNSAHTYGGNVYMTGGRLRRCKILSGKAIYTEWSAHGGNIYANAGIVENCLVAGGNASRGSGIYANGEVMVVNCTFVKNPSGEAVYVNNSNAKIVNCAIYDNGGTAATEWGGKNDACFINCAFSAEAAYSGTASTVTNLTDADFKDYSSGDYHPVKNGVLVNAGSKWAEYTGYGATSETDLAGDPRLSGSRLDIGCYEIPSGVGLLLIVR